MIQCEKWISSSKIKFHRSATFMDYLHGDVYEEEAGIACYYEYARESRAIWDAAKERDNLMRKKKCSCEQAAFAVIANSPVRKWYQTNPLALSFLSCKSFPFKDWNALSVHERNAIQRYEQRKAPPLYMPDVRSPHGWKGMVWAMHKKFKELADKSRPVIEDVPPGKAAKPSKPVPAMTLKEDSIYLCLFEVDFSESPDHLANRFLAWLKQPEIEKLWQEHKQGRTSNIGEPLRISKVRQHSKAVHYCMFEVNLAAPKGLLAKHFKKWLSENRERLNRYGIQKRGKTGEWHDRLKDLAACRLYRENDNDWERANEFADRSRGRFKDWKQIHLKCKRVKGKWPYKPDDLRPFYNARKLRPQNGQSVPANRADLFSCDDDFRHAKGSAKKFLAAWIPSEFKQPSWSLAFDWRFKV